MNPPITNASVRVLRSHDYCHFEVCLSTDQDACVMSAEAVDDLRKTAARLADKAVEQYKIAKNNAQRILDQSYGFQRVKALADEARKIPESDRTPEHKANIKALEDFVHHQKYDYEDSWEED